MVSLVRIASGHEFLLQPQDVGRKYGRPRYGDKMEDFDASGFDECFPTILACKDPLDPNVLLPDHGELWPVPWTARPQDNGLTLEVHSRALPCRFRKRIQLEGEEVVIEYQLTNESNRSISYLWSAHPLLRVEPGTRIELPAEVDQMLVHWSLSDSLGHHGDLCAWPLADREGQREDLSRVGPPSSQSADKLFTGRLKHGWCSLYHPATDESIGFRFDPQRTPYIGLWMTIRGWHKPDEPGHFTVALEPCNGRPDSLDEAHARGECAELKPNEVHTWWLRLQVKQGPYSFLENA